MIQKDYILEDINNVIYFSESSERVNSKVKKEIIRLFTSTGLTGIIGGVSVVLTSSWILFPFILLVVLILSSVMGSKIQMFKEFLAISPKNADQLEDLAYSLDDIEGFDRNQKILFFQSIIEDSNCMKKKKEFAGSKNGDESVLKLDCTKEMLDIFDKKVQSHPDIPSSKKKELIQKSKKLKRDLIIK